MKGIMYFLFSLSIILLSGMAHFYLSSKRPGVYPPRHILKKRSTALGLGGVIFIFLGWIFYVLQ